MWGSGQAFMRSLTLNARVAINHQLVHLLTIKLGGLLRF
jgi:hypothetical protein